MHRKKLFIFSRWMYPKMGSIEKNTVYIQSIYFHMFRMVPRWMPENYRPLSLTCVPCKILEHIIPKHYRDHLERHGILNYLNHGFRSKFCCETQLLLTLQDLLTFRDRKIKVDIAILDFSKAFDTVPHDHVLRKLQFYSIHGPLLDWTASFLKTRTQSVVADGNYSKLARVLSGVQQGTVLGLLLYLLHLNDLPSVVTSSVRLFADDCLLYCPIRCAADQFALQRDLSALQHWGDTWGMRLNAGKCHIMQVHRGLSLFHFYTLCGQVLSLVEEANYRGVLLASDLGWSPYVATTAGKASSALGFHKRNLKKCPAALKERAYIAYVRSILDYASPIWDPHLKKDIHALERVNRRAARYVIDDYHRLSSVSSMLRSLGWSTLEDRRREARLTLFYKIVKGEIAVSSEDIYLELADRQTRSTHKFKYKTKSASTSNLSNFVTHNTIKDWNTLPASVVDADSSGYFKSRLARLRPQAI